MIRFRFFGDFPTTLLSLDTDSYSSIYSQGAGDTVMTWPTDQLGAEGTLPSVWVQSLDGATIANMQFGTGSVIDGVPELDRDFALFGLTPLGFSYDGSLPTIREVGDALRESGEGISAMGGVWRDIIRPTRFLRLDGDDKVRGMGGNDRLSAGQGDDLVRGGRGDDILRGGYGDDTLAGDEGGDRLVGGEGADTFMFTPDQGRDVIIDFNVAEDTILLTQAETYYWEIINDNLRISGDSGLMILRGVTDISLVNIAGDYAVPSLDDLLLGL